MNNTESAKGSDAHVRVDWAPGAMLCPVPPALVTCGAGEGVNVFTVGWTGMLATKPPKTYISVRPQRHSHGIIKESGEFAINIPTGAMVRAVDTCGVKSGREVNKFKLCGLETARAKVISAPLLAACPISLECRVDRIIPMGSHDMFIADIVSVSIDSAYINKKDGRLMIEKCGLLAYAHGSYFQLGKQLGTFGSSVRKKAPHNRRGDKKRR